MLQLFRRDWAELLVVPGVVPLVCHVTASCEVVERWLQEQKRGARRNAAPLEALRQAAKVATPSGSPYRKPARTPNLRKENVAVFQRWRQVMADSCCSQLRRGLRSGRFSSGTAVVFTVRPFGEYAPTVPRGDCSINQDGGNHFAPSQELKTGGASSRSPHPPSQGFQRRSLHYGEADAGTGRGHFGDETRNVPVTPGLPLIQVEDRTVSTEASWCYHVGVLDENPDW